MIVLFLKATAAGPPIVMMYCDGGTILYDQLAGEVRGDHKR